jgi:hypothetical protein
MQPGASDESDADEYEEWELETGEMVKVQER